MHVKVGPDAAYKFVGYLGPLTIAIAGGSHS
jgi:hypothetical protein